MKINTKIFTASWGTLILFLIFVLFNTLSLAQKKGENTKKKLYISSIKSNGVSPIIANRIKEGIRLAIFENYGNKYQVLDDDAIKVMYKQAEAILSSSCNDTSCITQIADGINADEIIYGDVSQEGRKIAISINDLERKGLSLSTKSIVKLSFFESQLDYAVSETTKKLMNPQYKIDISKALEIQEVKLGGIEIQAVKGLDISIIQFKSDDETIDRIIEYSKSIVTEGDNYFNKQNYILARDKYSEIIERVRTKLSVDKQIKVKEYINGVRNRINSAFIMEYKLEIEKIDNKLKNNNEIKIADLSKGLSDYLLLENQILKIPDSYNKSRMQLLDAINDRKNSVYIANALIYEKSGDSNYRNYNFADALNMYNKAIYCADNIKDSENKIDIASRINSKINTTKNTGQGYFAHRVKSLLDQVEFYNYQLKIGNAKATLKDARSFLTGNMSKFITIDTINSFNNIAQLLNSEKITVVSNPELFTHLNNYDRIIYIYGKKMEQFKSIKPNRFISQGWLDNNNFITTSTGVSIKKLNDKRERRKSSTVAGLIMALKHSYIEKFKLSNINGIEIEKTDTSVEVVLPGEFQLIVNNYELIESSLIYIDKFFDNFEKLNINALSCIYDDDDNCEVQIVIPVSRKN